MFYTTLSGILKFTSELKASELATLNTILGEHWRGHPEWELSFCPRFTRINLELTEDFDGLTYVDVDDVGDTDQSYDLAGQVNAVVELMRRIKPDFGLSGQLLAHQKATVVRWVLDIEGGQAVEREIETNGSVYRCPHCKGIFVASEADKIQ